MQRSHARCIGTGACAAFQRLQSFLQGGDSGIAVTRIDIPACSPKNTLSISAIDGSVNVAEA